MYLSCSNLIYLEKSGVNKNEQQDNPNPSTHLNISLATKYILLHGFRVHTIFIHEAATFHERSREALRPSD